MATRDMYAGATFPPLYLQAKDATGLLDLTTATSLEVVLDTNPTVPLSGTQVTGSATAIALPGHMDEDGEYFNAVYHFATGDTAVPGLYGVFLFVVWSPGSLEIFGQDELEIKPSPL